MPQIITVRVQDTQALVLYASYKRVRVRTRKHRLVRVLSCKPSEIKYSKSRLTRPRPRQQQQRSVPKIHGTLLVCVHFGHMILSFVYCLCQRSAKHLYRFVDPVKSLFLADHFHDLRRTGGSHLLARYGCTYRP